MSRLLSTDTLQPGSMKVLVTLLLTLALAAPLANAQGTLGTFVGTVSDQTSAVIPGAAVTVTNVATGVRRTAATNERGEYEVPLLGPGQYRIEAAFEGFKRAVTENVTLTIGQRLRVDITLQPGDLQEAVSVTAEAPLIQTDQSRVAHLITNTQINTLPLNDRNVLNFVTQLPGVATGGGSYLIGGSRAYTTNFTMEGLNTTDEKNKTPVGVPPLDAVQEFELKSNLMSAESGSSSSQISMALKSGTNSLHGSAYDYYRSKFGEARNYFNPTNKIPSRVKHQGGATLGGPIQRDKSFFFYSFSGNSDHSSKTATALVPTDAMRAGDFSASTTPIMNPFSATSATNWTMTQFPENKIPAELIHPIAKRLLDDIYPKANVGTSTFFSNLPTPSSSAQHIGRVDHELTAKDRVYGFFNVNDATSTNYLDATPYSNGYNNQYASRIGLIRYTRLLSPTLINEAAIGYVRNASETLLVNRDTNWLQELGIKGVPVASDYEAGGLPYMWLSPYLHLRDESWYPAFYVSNNYSVSNNLTWSKAAHSLKAGFEVRRLHLNDRQRPYTRGYWYFTSWPSNDPFANFLLGVPSNTYGSTGRDIAYTRKWQSGYYIQDDWKVRPWLTMNIGLRYELYTNAIEKYDRLASFDIRTGKMVVSGPDGRLPERGIHPAYFDQINIPLITTKEAGLPRSIASTDYRDLAPRFGFALRPFGLKTTVLRGGYGIYFYPLRQYLMLTGANNPPFQVSSSSWSGTGNWLDMGDPFGKNFSIYPSSSVYALSPDYRNSYYQNWNFTIEQDLGFDTAVRLSYIGNKGSRLNQSIDVNFSVPVVGPDGEVTTVRKFPQFSAVRLTTSEASSIYNGVELEFKKRWSHGLSFDANYTWANAITEADLDNWEPQSMDLRLERAKSNFVPNQTFNFNATYQLPVGAGKRFMNKTGVVNHLFGGWNVAVLSQFRSGLWFTPAVSGSANGNKLWGRPDLVGDPNKGPRTAERWYDPYAFKPVPVGSANFGNSGRSVIEGPGLAIVDAAVFKTVRIRQGHSLTLRIESFNVANHTNFNLGSFQQEVTFPGTAGRIFSTLTPARQFQFGLRYDF